jgi:hypothetical protein
LALSHRHRCGSRQRGGRLAERLLDLKSRISDVAKPVLHVLLKTAAKQPSHFAGRRGQVLPIRFVPENGR